MNGRIILIIIGKTYFFL